MSPLLPRTGENPAPALAPAASRSAGISTARKDSTCARSSQASAFAAGTVIMSVAPQLFRMPTWRVM